MPRASYRASCRVPDLTLVHVRAAMCTLRLDGGDFSMLAMLARDKQASCEESARLARDEATRALFEGSAESWTILAERVEALAEVL